MRLPLVATGRKMAHMRDHAAGLRFVGALALTVAILIELAAEGVVTLIGIAALGAVLAAWTVVYSAWHAQAAPWSLAAWSSGCLPGRS